MGRLRDKKGMSIAELLSSIAVMLLVTVVLVTGVRLGVKAYTKSVSMSQAQVLCSIIATTVSDELRYAGNIYLDENNEMQKFFVSGKGLGNFGSNSEGHVTFADKLLLSKASYPYGLKAEVTVNMDGSEKTFNAEVRVMSKNDNVLSGSAFQVKPLNELFVYSTD